MGKVSKSTNFRQTLGRRALELSPAGVNRNGRRKEYTFMTNVERPFLLRSTTTRGSMRAAGEGFQETIFLEAPGLRGERLNTQCRGQSAIFRFTRTNAIRRGIWPVFWLIVTNRIRFDCALYTNDRSCEKGIAKPRKMNILVLCR